MIVTDKEYTIGEIKVKIIVNDLKSYNKKFKLKKQKLYHSASINGFLNRKMLFIKVNLNTKLFTKDLKYFDVIYNYNNKDNFSLNHPSLYFDTFDESKINNDLYDLMIKKYVKLMKENYKIKLNKIQKLEKKVKKKKIKLKEDKDELKLFSIFEREDKINNIFKTKNIEEDENLKKLREEKERLELKVENGDSKIHYYHTYLPEKIKELNEKLKK